MTIVLAGATGDLGGRIARALAARGGEVVAPVRPNTPAERLAPLERVGVRAVPVRFDDTSALAEVCRGATCVVSALNGLEDTMLVQQGHLLDAAVAAGVPRFVPSDFALDFTRTVPGDNRNLDLRRRFMARVDAAPIAATSILNGAFADLLTGQAPIVLCGIRRVLHWGDADQPYDFTARDDVAAYAAAAALDRETPRILRIAGDTVTPRMLAATMSGITGRRYRTLRAGSIGTLSAIIAVAKRFGRDDAVFPAWQGMQYLRDMAGGRGRLDPLDNDRYPMRWTTVREVLAAA